MIDWFLTISLIILLLFVYYTNGKNFLSPSFIVVVSFCISSIFLSINLSNWRYEISLYTYFVIMGSLIFFYCGEKISNLLIKNKVNSNIILNRVSMPSTSVLLLCLVFGVITFVLYYFQQRSNALLISSDTSLAGIITANRLLYYSESSAYVNIVYKNSQIIRLLIIAFKSIAHIIIGVYLYNLILFKKREKTFFVILMILVYLLISLMSSNRTDIFILSCFMLFMVLFLYYKKKNWKINGFKTLLFCLVSFSIILLLFRFFGFFTGKSESISFFDNISKYIGGGLPPLDKYLTQNNFIPIEKESEIQLFKGIYLILNRFDSSITVSTKVLPHQFWNNNLYGTNIYTSLFPYVYKFGIFGAFLVEFLIGFTFGVVWQKIRSNKTSFQFIILYASLFWILGFYSIGEELFEYIISLTFVVEVFVIYSFAWLFVIKKQPILNNNVDLFYTCDKNISIN